mgnify:FL=1
MERFGYDFNQKLALAQVSAYCGENVEQTRACCHTSPSFERDLFKNSYVMLKGTLEGYEKLFISEERRGSRGQSEEVREQNQHRREFLQAVSKTADTTTQRKKLERTLKRIKDKGLFESCASKFWLPDFEFAGPDGVQKGKPNWQRVRNLLCGLMQCGSKVDFTIHSLTDEEWLSAIETAVALHYPEDIVDDSVSSYAIHIPELMNEIWILVVLIHMANSYESLLMESRFDRQKSEEYDDLADAYRSLVSAYNELAAKQDRESESTKVSEIREQAERQKKEDGKKIFALERDVEKLRQEVEKLRREKDHIADLWTREMDALTSEPSENEPSADKGNQIAAVEAENQPTDEELFGNVELPEKNVLFLGGWTKLVQSVKQRHPHWLFINSDDDRHNKGSERIDTVFFFYGYISHKLAWRVYNELRDDVETIFVSQKNEAKMELEMKKGYALAQEAKQANAETA